MTIKAIPQRVAAGGLIIALLAAILLAALDYILIASSFLYAPTGGEILSLAMLAGAVAAVLLRRRWLLLVTQNAVTVLVFARLIEAVGDEANNLSSLLIPVTLVAAGNLLAWLVARAIPPRRR